MTQPKDPLHFVSFNPKGLTVSGKHSPAHAPVTPELAALCEDRHKAWLQKILANPLSFDGHRAVLQDFHADSKSLQLQTAYRTYTQGRALRDAWIQHQAGVPLSKEMRDYPDKGVSWGLSLLTFVLLPFGHLLCAQRSPNLMVSPGEWKASFTEVIEPEDITVGSMQPLLDRLVEEELPTLRGLGPHRFVGMGVREETYTWQLVSTVDLRKPTIELYHALEGLLPDPETSAWSVVSASLNSANRGWFPASTLSGQAVQCGDIDIGLSIIAALEK